MCAFTAIDGEINGDLNIFNTYMKGANHQLNFDGIIRRKKPQCYEDYLNFMNIISNEKNITVDVLEEKLFGLDRSKDKTSNNPRIKYWNWAKSKGLEIRNS